MVMIQVDEVKTGFLSIDEMSRNGWKEVMRPRTGSTGNSPAPSGVYSYATMARIYYHLYQHCIFIKKISQFERNHYYLLY